MAFQQFHISFLVSYEHASILILWGFCGIWDSPKHPHIFPSCLFICFFKVEFLLSFSFLVSMSTLFFWALFFFSVSKLLYNFASCFFVLIIYSFYKHCWVLTVKQWALMFCEGWCGNHQGAGAPSSMVSAVLRGAAREAGRAELGHATNCRFSDGFLAKVMTKWTRVSH